MWSLARTHELITNMSNCRTINRDFIIMYVKIVRLVCMLVDCKIVVISYTERL